MSNDGCSWRNLQMDSRDIKFLHSRPIAASFIFFIFDTLSLTNASHVYLRGCKKT